MAADLFECTDYGEYLQRFLALPKNRGLKSRLAEALGVRAAFVTQVIQGKAHLTLENAALTSRFLRLSSRGERYFLALVGKARSGNSVLSEHYERELRHLRQEDAQIQTRVGETHSFTLEDQLWYFGDCRIAAIQLLATHPGCGTPAKLAEQLAVDPRFAAETLERLVSLGVLERSATAYRLTRKRIHLGLDSPLLSRHHMNWRLQAIRSLENSRTTDLHYSSVWSLGAEDVARIRTMLLEIIERAEPILKASPDEQLYSFCMDWFHIAESPRNTS